MHYTLNLLKYSPARWISSDIHGDRERQHGQAGFSLIELALVMIIAAILLISTYTLLIQTTRLSGDEARDPIKAAQQGLAEYLRVYGYLPCPANLTADRGDSNYSIGDCSAAISVAGENGGNVLVGALPVNDIQTVLECREDTSMPSSVLDVLSSSLDSARDIVSGGGVNSLDNQKCISRRSMIDEHGNKIVYAVSQAASADVATRINPRDTSIGQIEILDANGNAMTDRYQAYILISHGPDGKGAYSPSGEASGAACGSDSGALDNENCDYNSDAVFRNALFAEREDNNHFDDRIDFSLAGSKREENLWNLSGDNTGDLDMIFNVPGQTRLFVGNVASSTSPTYQSNRLVIGTDSDGTPGGILLDNGGLFDVQQTTDSLGNKQGGSVDADEIQSKRVGAGEAVYSEKYCYDPPLTPACQ